MNSDEKALLDFVISNKKQSKKKIYIYTRLKEE